MLQLSCSLQTPSASLRLFSGSLAPPNGETGAAQAGNRWAARAVGTGGGTRPKHEGEPKSGGFFRGSHEKGGITGLGGGGGRLWAMELESHCTFEEWEADNQRVDPEVNRSGASTLIPMEAEPAEHRAMKNDGWEPSR